MTERLESTAYLWASGSGAVSAQVGDVIGHFLYLIWRKAGDKQLSSQVDSMRSSNSLHVRAEASGLSLYSA